MLCRFVRAASFRSSCFLISAVMAVLLVCGAGREEAQKRAQAERGSQTSPPAGIGAVLKIGDAGLEIRKVLPDSPAARSGKLHPGDRVIAIGDGAGNAVNTKGMSIKDAVAKIRGLPGTVVALHIVPVGKSAKDARVVTLTRGTVKELDLFGDGRYLAVGTKAPNLNAIHLGSGRRESISRSQVTVIEFWATWCGPCIKAIDRLQQVRHDHPDWKGRVSFIAASVDEKKDAASAYAQSRARDWSGVTIHWGGPQLLKEFHIEGLPAVYVLDANGNVLAAGHGVDVSKVVGDALKGGPR